MSLADSRVETRYVRTCRNFRLDDADLDHAMREAFDAVFTQDKEAVDAIESVISRYEPDHPIQLNIRVDAGALHCRTIIEGMNAEERELRSTQPRHGETLTCALLREGSDGGTWVA